eukprot:TRINITY_DN34293_c0_g1_i1.p1 TRINITY_DN34293_c0_g1~~TRINITY_DN34293_c0_g1_i1.p1  ORF type:complete len:191 (+),score=44.38 TRINITY_DN34293_c0_g1_i1:32-604(+)
MAENVAPAAVAAPGKNVPHFLKLDEKQLNKIRATERNKLFKEEKGVNASTKRVHGFCAAVRPPLREAQYEAEDLVRRIAKNPAEVKPEDIQAGLLPVCDTLLKTCQYLELCMEHRADDVQQLVISTHTVNLATEDQKTWNEIVKKREKKSKRRDSSDSEAENGGGRDRSRGRYKSYHRHRRDSSDDSPEM